MKPQYVLVAMALCLGGCSSAESEDEGAPVDEGALRGNVASDEGFPGAIAADTTTIYWASDQENRAGIYARPRDGSRPATKIASTAPPTAALALDAAAVYWVDNAGKLFSIAKRGGEARKIGELEPQRTTSLAIDDTHVYASTGRASLSKTPKAGGTTTKIGEGAITAMTADATNLYYVKQTVVLGPQGPEFVLFRLPKSGAYPQDEKKLGTVKNDEPLGLVSDRGQIYYTVREPRADKQRIVKVDMASGEERDLDASPLYRPHVGAVSGDALCFANREEIACQRTSGGAPVEVAKGKAIDNIALEGGSIFWTDRAESKGWFDNTRQVADSGAVKQLALPNLR